MEKRSLSGLIIFALACGGPQPSAPAPAGGATAVRVSEVEWEPLNPARGDASPMAATLWGDRNGSSATGFLFGPVDGFESPPHIHNVTYRGVVIRGLVHNADPAAEETWMPSGSFWTQPRGDAHITSARGSDTMAYIEIDEGPYLVHPVEDAFESGEQPINVVADDIAWTDTSSASVRVANLWGDREVDGPRGLLVAIAAGSRVALGGGFTDLRAVVIQGRVALASDAALEPGSYVHAAGELDVACEAAEACQLYLRVQGRLDVVARPPRG